MKNLGLKTGGGKLLMNELEVIKGIDSIEKTDSIETARIKLQQFTKLLNREPDQSELRVNKFANNSKYLPVSFIEMALDEYFFGLWNIENFKYQVIANEIVGDLELVVYHPTSLTWIRRSGAGSVQIKTKRESDPMDINNKIQNTLVMDFPKLKAECLKNAAKSFGKLFGRDLNRKDTDDYNPIIKAAKTYIVIR
jgi:hypothetical protein